MNKFLLISRFFKMSHHSHPQEVEKASPFRIHINFEKFCVTIFYYFLKTFAEDIDIDKIEADCLSKSENFTTEGMTKCEYKAYDMWDKEMNKYYNLLRKKLSPQEKETLKTAQLAWINYRDKEFENINNIFNKMEGTMYIPIRVDYRNSIIKKRALELKNYYDLLKQNYK